MRDGQLRKLVRTAAFAAFVIGANVLVFVVRLDVFVIRGDLGPLVVSGREYKAFCPAGWPPPPGTAFLGFAPYLPGGEPARLTGEEPRTGAVHTVEADDDPTLALHGRLLVGRRVLTAGSDRLEELPSHPDARAELIVRTGGEPRALSIWQIVRRPNGSAYLASEFRDAFERHGILSPIVFVLVYVLGTVILFPATILTIVGAFAFGRLWGSVWVMVGMNLGGAAAFLVGRWVGRDTVERFLPPKIAALSQSLERRGFRTILLLRLIPVCPYNLLNYGAGVTRMRFVDFFVGGLIGMTPVMILWVQATLSVTDMQLSRPLTWLPIVGLAILVAAPLLLLRVRWSRRSRAEGEPRAETEAKTETENPGTG